MREKVISSDEPIQRIYNKKSSEFSDKGLNIALGSFPTYESVKHFLHDARNKSAQVSKTVFKNVGEVEVPVQFKDFLLADYYHEEGEEQTRILVFCSKDSREKIPEIKEYFVDGTFYSCPPPFAQIYNIHGDVNSTSETTTVMPLIFALMSNRTEKSYKILFNLILSQLPEWEPLKIHCDYEKAAMNAISKVFPNCTIKGCYYHWVRNIWKNAESPKYRITKSKPEKRIVGLTAALPLMPADKILEGLDYIKSECVGLKRTDKFIRYIENFWLKVHTPDVFSVYGERHRTTNIVESFHSKVNKLLNKNTLTLMRLLNVLHDIHKKKITSNKRRPEQIMNDDFITEVQMKLVHNEVTIGHALDQLR